ncbi:hypothetical protein CHS0354_037109 [Potamilus streckersoni]|uniref:Heat shock 70 kDa protein 12A n=1 Tax=Potamilus streckersoni TaxID=2493646 RepID=A0AAE0VHN6_9BIVA|nr:hypothetical protein CHS0354_037109 [Potamilus streckersoni]
MGTKQSRLDDKRDASKSTTDSVATNTQTTGRRADVEQETSPASIQQRIERSDDAESTTDSVVADTQTIGRTTNIEQETSLTSIQQRIETSDDEKSTTDAVAADTQSTGRTADVKQEKSLTSIRKRIKTQDGEEVSLGFQHWTRAAGYHKKTLSADFNSRRAAAADFRQRIAAVKQEKKITTQVTKGIGPSVRKSSALVVAAIDFGTTFSGYAFSFKSKPKEVFAFHWENGCIKTPTVVLLDSTGKLNSFGKTAETTYLGLAKEGKAKEWYYFEKFKMQLYIKSQLQNQTLSRDMIIKDLNGKKLCALDVFSAAILYLKQHLLDFLNSREKHVHVTLEDIHWVLTVPAIWNDSSKQFMREAASKAGISNDLLTLALEPEAASIYCMKGVTLQQLSKSTTYMVLDIGGGTADITCHQILDDGSLGEVYLACGGDYGGTMVDNEFFKLFRSIFGADIIEKYKDQHLDDYLAITQTFDRKKRYFDGSSKRDISIRIPVELIELFEEEIGQSVDESIRQHPRIGQFSLRHGNLCISSKLLQTFFDGAISNINDEVKSLLQKLPQVSYILMVGGFSESPYLQKNMQIMFGDKILIPPGPSEAVVKGAVMFGHNPSVISQRVCRYTYGIERMMRFKEGVHPAQKKVIVNGFEYVDNLFNKHITRGDVIKIGNNPRAQAYYPPGEGVRQVFLPVYASTKASPIFVDEKECIYLGHVYAELTEFDLSTDMKLLVKLIFSGTELRVEIREEKTGKIIRGSVNFLG